MKTDLYTKIVLTIIAVVLSINLLKDFDFITPANANNGSAVPAANITAPKYEGVIDVNIVRVNGNSIGSYGLDFNLKGINGSSPSSSFSTLNVNVKELGGSSVSSSSGMPVKVTNYRDFN